MAYIGRGLDKISNVEKLDNLTFDGSSTSFALQKGGSSFVPSSANNILLSIDGVVQAGNFTVSGSTIDFGTAISGSSTCDFILHYGVGVITTPADGSVTTAKIQDSSVSLAKLTATGTQDATTFLRGDNTFAVPAGGDNTPSFSATLSSNQSVSDSVSTEIIFNSEHYDTDSAYNTSTGRFTVPAGEGGKYFFNGCVNAYAGTNNLKRILMRLYKNGSPFAYFSSNNWDNQAYRDQETATGSTIISLSAGDYIELYIWFSHASSGNTTIVGSSASEFITKLSGYKIIE